LKQLRIDENPLIRELFIAFNPVEAEINDAIKPRFSEQFLDHEERLIFIKNAIRDGQFIAIHVYMSLTGRPDLEMLQSEINYVSVYAIHKAKELEEQLWNIAAIGNLIDVTDEVMHRYDFNQPDIVANQSTPQSHAVGNTDIKALLKD
jgi:hypothetical protein